MAGRHSLSTRVFVVLFLFSLVIMVAAAVASMAASYSVYENEAERSLLNQASTYARSLQGENQQAMCDDLAGLASLDTRCTLIAADGTVLFDNYADAASMDNHAGREEVAAAKATGQSVSMRRSDTLGTETLYAAELVDSGIVLRLAETRASLMSYLGGMAWQLAVSSVVILLLSLLVSRWLTGMIVKPLREVDLSAPLDNDAYEELQPLLQRVDVQRKELESQNRKLERAVDMRREFTGNVSHEMKTPLQVIGGYAELIESGMVAQKDVPKFAGLIRTEAVSMRNLIDDVLTLSRLDEHVTASDASVALDDACRRVGARLAAAAQEREVAVELQLEAAPVVKGDISLVEQMIYNLVDNAIKYNKDGGTALVRLWTEDSNALLSVEDEGPGVPIEARGRIFERFYRADESRSRETGGTGLGLAIVKHEVEELHGTVEVGTSDDLGGARFLLTLPIDISRV